MSASINLSAQFWISKWRVPGRVEVDTYAALLCIDPNGVRTTNKGPIIYVLDNIEYKPGLSEKSGVFMASLNDNANGVHRDMELLEEGTFWIRDDDEFWVGFQRGPSSATWDPTGGVDGEGAGRKWLGGGYINNRYYVYAADTRISAKLVGKGYMDVWKDQLFGTPTIPRDYTGATDVARIARDIIVDINTFQPAGWRYSEHPTEFPESQALTVDAVFGATACLVPDNTGFVVGDAFIWDDDSPGEIVTITGFTGGTQIDFIGSPIQQILGYLVASNARIIQAIGVEWKKEFKQEASSDVMSDIVDEAGYEWRIDYLRRVMLYARSSPPTPSASSSAYTIRYTTNFRNASKIVMGDTTEKITHAIVTDGASNTMPPDIDAWCLNPSMWPDLTNPVRAYGAAALPAPCNPSDAIYSDVSLIMDDQGHPALCFQMESAPNFNLNLSLYVDAVLATQASNLNLDLREWRRLKFRFRHASRVTPDAGTIYRAFIRTLLNDVYYYDFGRGAGLSPQLVAGDTDHDTILYAVWCEIDLLLPECDVDGNVTDLHGWIPVGTPDPMDINWVSISVFCAEASPGHGPGQALTVGSAAGTQYLAVANPELFAGLDGTGTSTKRFWQESVCLVQKGATSEEVRLRGTSLDSTPAPYNVELAKELNNNYNLPGPTPRLYLKGGWTICFSQLYFERNLRYEEAAVSPTPPYRYRMLISKEMENLNEAQARAGAIIEQETETLKFINLLVYGSPDFEIGYRSRVYLGIAPFNNVWMILDDVQYSLGADQDFIVTLMLGLITANRPREINERSVLNQHERHIRNLGLGDAGMVRR